MQHGSEVIHSVIRVGGKLHFITVNIECFVRGIPNDLIYSVTNKYTVLLRT